jgi:hypothetical protein
MPSERYLQLQAQLSILRTHLLPDPFEETGLYNDEEKVATTALAYRVLAHAEIEAYFEDRALETVNRARIAWKDHSHISRVSLCLMAFSGRTMALPPEALEPPGENSRKAWPELLDIGKRLNAVITAFNTYVRTENHGIKEKNLLSLLLPIGIDHSSLNSGFLADIESFGSMRGHAAHTSSRAAVRRAVDPREELNRVESLLGGIADIDTLLDELVKGIPHNAPA